MICTGNESRFKVGVACDVDVKAFVTGFETTLLGDAQVIAIGFALTGAEAAAHFAIANGEATTDALLFAVVGATVLDAFDVQVTPDVRADVLAGGGSTFEVGVAPGFNCQCLTGFYFGMGMGNVLAIGSATCTTGAQVEKQAIGTQADTDAGAGGFVFAALFAGVLTR